MIKAGVWWARVIKLNVRVVWQNGGFWRQVFSAVECASGGCGHGGGGGVCLE